MDATRAPDGRIYVDFQPISEWLREAGSDTLLLTLPGFKREQLKVQLDNYGNLKVSGERPAEGNKLNRFYKEVRIPENCNFNEIRAKFENGVLHVILPKTIPWENTVSPLSPKTPKSDKAPESEIVRADVHTPKTPKSDKAPESEIVRADGHTPKTPKPDKAPESEIGRADVHRKPTSGPTSRVTDEKITLTSGPEKQLKGPNDDGKFTNGTKKKEAEEERPETRKTSDGSTERTEEGGPLKEIYMHGGGLLLGFDQSRQLLVNVLVALLVMLALLVYISHKLI